MSILDRFSLAGKRALVTGASRGLGRAMAVGLAEAGADVVCASSKPGGADKTANAIRSLGRTAWTVDADLGDRDAVQKMA
jgi:2-deoxy-D-gluconate 3-dehydrogenase